MASTSDGIEEAASAFLDDISPAPTPKTATAGDGPDERIFARDDDEESGNESQSGDDTEVDQADEGASDEPDDGEPGVEAKKPLEEGELDPDTEVEVTIDGKQEAVTLKEAVDGYIRRETFDRRMNQLSDAARNVKAEADRVAADKLAYANKLQIIDEEISRIVPKRPSAAEWDAMYRDDPAAARQLEIQWKNWDHQSEALKAEKTRANAELKDRQDRELADYARAESQKVTQVIPTWVDPKVAAKDQADMKKTALAVGLQQQELDTLYDSRMLAILHKAAMYDRLKATTPMQKVQSSVRPGVVNRAGPAPKGDQSFKRLARSGSMEDASKAFESSV